MSVKKELEKMNTSTEAIAYYNSYMANYDRQRMDELAKIISDAEKELKTLEKSVDPYEINLIIARVGELTVKENAV